MSSRPTFPQVEVAFSRESATRASADVLLVPLFEQDPLSDLADLDATTGGDLHHTLEAQRFRGRPFELLFTRMTDRDQRIIGIGCGPREKLTVERLRKVATAGATAARQRNGQRLAFLVRAGDLDAATQARAVAAGLVLAALGTDRYKTTPADTAPLSSATVHGPAETDLTEAVARGAVDGEHTNVARWLSDEPGNVITPVTLAERARDLLAGSAVSVDILDERALTELNMGLLLGVARGSAEPPRVIVMRYTPAQPASDHVLGLVGKAVTFDSGGISIKVAEGMEKMKHDMSGGAAVIAAMRAIGRLAPPVAVLGVVPAVENMPGGRALKPGDILTSASGKTVEIVNTDAEGRLILADALWYARHEGATHLVDVATLTGAVVIALGRACSGLFGAPAGWLETVGAASSRAGERTWPLPADDDYADLLKSDSADMVNSGGRAGGAIAGAMFIREFTGGLPWAHLDVAGTAWADDTKPWQPKGATGVAVRTLTELATSVRTWS